MNEKYEKKKIAIFIDGSNLKGCIGRVAEAHRKERKLRDAEYYHLDHQKMIGAINKYNNEVIKIFYVTSEPKDTKYQKKSFYERLSRFGYKIIIKDAIQGRKEKGVDMAVAIEMLIFAFNNYYDEAILVAGDADYCQLVREVQRLGKRVGLAYYGLTFGLSNELLYDIDYFIDLSETDLLIKKTNINMLKKIDHSPTLPTRSY